MVVGALAAVAVAGCGDGDATGIGAPASAEVARCVPSHCVPTAGVVIVGTPTNPSTGTCWDADVVRSSEITLIGVVALGPVTAFADVM